MRSKEGLELELDEVRKEQAATVAGAQVVGKAQSSDVERASGPKRPDERESAIREEIRGIDEQIGGLIEEYDSHFNPHWGELLYAGNDKTYFFMAVERYACTYTSRVSNLLNYSPAHYFRPPMKSYRAH